jgi:hypothetical protein
VAPAPERPLKKKTAAAGLEPPLKKQKPVVTAAPKIHRTKTTATAPVAAALEIPRKTKTATAAPEVPPKKKKTVSFGNVQGQEYSLTLGDHSLCEKYPIRLDWAHTEAVEYDLDARDKAPTCTKHVTSDKALPVRYGTKLAMGVDSILSEQ